MDTSDPGIEFDAQGICNRCRHYELLHAADTPDPERRHEQRNELVGRIKHVGRSKDYDCVIGVSGGVDSTYTALLVKRHGLRPLAVHLDNGWDSEMAVSNIEKCLKRLEIDLHTVVLDWDEFRELQLAFLRASTPDSEVPTDHAIMASLRQTAARLGVRWLIMGTNVATEGVGVATWSSGHADWRYIRGLNDRFGTRPLKSYPHYSLLQNAYYRYILRQRTVSLLDYLDYHKEEALALLKSELGYEPYRGKHHESVYTRFFQSYILPIKFGFDKRRAHLSALVMSGQISREAALEDLQKPIMPMDQIKEDRVFVIKKLGITEAAFEQIMAAPCKAFLDYPSYEKGLIIRTHRLVSRILRVRRAKVAREAREVSCR
jgi:N-acetyl sugar amidotransferase